LLDYAEPALQLEGSATIAKAVENLHDEAAQTAIRRQLERIRNGERDICV
jgi:putative component of toxin-antitoxin plasmid stabilization module